jgi:hypothetical protein
MAEQRSGERGEDALGDVRGARAEEQAVHAGRG